MFALELIDVIVLLCAFLILFYLLMEFVLPFFTTSLKPGWLFFNKWQEKKKAKEKLKKENKNN